MDIVVLRRGLHVSVSAIKEYLRCPRAFEMHRVRGVEPAFVPVPLAFGSAFHAALAFFYGMIKEGGAVPSLDDVTSVFVDAWRNAADGPLALQSDDEDDAGVDHEGKGIQMIAAFHAHATAAPVQVEAVEQGFAVELHDPDTGEVLEEHLVGAFDLVLREDDRRVICEHKSSSRKYGLDQITFDHQMTAYRLAARQLGLGERVGLRYQIVTKTKVPAVQVADLVRGDADEDDFLRTVVGVLRAVEAGAFYPVRGWQCRGCQYAHKCAGAKIASLAKAA